MEIENLNGLINLPKEKENGQFATGAFGQD